MDLEVKKRKNIYKIAWPIKLFIQSTVTAYLFIVNLHIRLHINLCFISRLCKGP